MAFQPSRGYKVPSPVLPHDHSQRHVWTHQEPKMHINNAIHTRREFDIMDPESEDSDVSGGENELDGSPFPINLPPPPTKQSLESQEAITQYLAEMERIENHNILKHKQLSAKRARKDDRIARKRAEQDAKIQAIMSARTRRDNRIKQRRDREDVAFQQFYDHHEEEENRFRKRLKALKRGLPSEDQPLDSRRTSVNRSPEAFSVVPPPAKRHQSAHPSDNDIRSTPRPLEPSSFGQPPPDRHSHQYSSYQRSSNTPAYSPSASNSVYQTPTHRHSPAPSVEYRRVPDPRSSDFPPGGHMGNTVSPHNGEGHSRHPSMPNHHHDSLGPHFSSHAYDTRPPPPPPPPTHPPPQMSHGFAAVNAPSHPGFAAVNPAYSAPLQAQHAVNLDSPSQGHHITPLDHTPARANIVEEKAPTSTNKRAPSTTHPYQMSEAFANRHHHCEETDSLQRGIWTWYGPGGTQDRPTVPPTRMYLKCNHENCGRIDWRTVHGLQCHIVKNHEQPKGTIGSLEKALTAYGVPVQQIEEYEKIHGPGSGGTMADPKSMKLRAKQQQVVDRRDGGFRHSPSAADRATPQRDMVPPGAYKSGFPQQANGLRRSHSPIRFDSQPPRSIGGFAAVNNGSSRHLVFANDSREQTEARHLPFDASRGSESSSGWRSERSEGPTPVQDPPIRASPYDPTREASESHRIPQAVKPIQAPTAEQSEHHVREGSQNMHPSKGEHLPQPNKQNEDESANRGEDNQQDAKRLAQDQNLELVGYTESSEAKAETESPKQTLIKEPGGDSERGKASINEHVQNRPQLDEEVDEKPNLVQLDSESRTKGAFQSPEMSSRRIQPPRRESRRASMALAQRTSREKFDDGDSNPSPSARTTSKANSVVDDPNDTLIVDVEGIKADRDKERDDEKSKLSTPARRLNRRVARKSVF